jgi:PAS domain S-box-containing protein
MAAAGENACRSASVRASINVPLLRNGASVASIVVTSDRPRAWEEREVTLVQLVAERTWLWIERLRAQQSLHDSEARLRCFIDSVEDYSLLVLDSDGTIATWNEGAHRLTGYAETEIVGKHFSRLHVPDDRRAGKPAEVLAVAAERGTLEEEGWRLRKDGTTFWANVVIHALRDADGKLLGFGKVTRDMTERMRANEQLRLAVEAAPTGMLMSDDRGSIVLVNKQAETLFGYTRQGGRSCSASPSRC